MRILQLYVPSYLFSLASEPSHEMTATATIIFTRIAEVVANRRGNQRWGFGFGFHRQIVALIGESEAFSQQVLDCTRGKLR